VLEDGFDRWQTLFEDGITRMRERGILKPETDAANLACSILAALQGGLLLSQTRRTTQPLEAALDGALAVLRCHAV
jgi:hypothetical protein